MYIYYLYIIYIGKMLSNAFETTPEQELEKLNKKLEKRQNELNNSISLIQTLKQNLVDKILDMDNNLHETSLIFQSIEENRLYCIHTSLKKYCAMERTMIQYRNEYLSNLEDIINNIDIMSDIPTYIKEHKDPDQTHKYAVT